MSMNIDSDEDQPSSQQSVVIKNNYFPNPESSMSESDFEFEMEEDKEEEAEEKEGMCVHVACDDDDDDAIMSYDQITAMLGEDTTSDDYLSNLFEEEKRVNAS